MPDFTMCSGDGCPLKDDCKRFLASPSDYQSFFVNPPVVNGKCDSFWKGYKK